MIISIVALCPAIELPRRAEDVELASAKCKAGAKLPKGAQDAQDAEGSQLRIADQRGTVFGRWRGALARRCLPLAWASLAPHLMLLMISTISMRADHCGPLCMGSDWPKTAAVSPASHSLGRILGRRALVPKTAARWRHAHCANSTQRHSRSAGRLSTCCSGRRQV